MARRPFLCRSTDPVIQALTDAANAQGATASQIEAVSGVSRHSWQEWRDGRATPTLSGLQAVASVLGFEIQAVKRNAK